MSTTQSLKDSTPTHGREKLFLGEQWWAARWLWLKERGYTLRPRYHPDWKPSWKVGKKDARKYEDGQLPNVRSTPLCSMMSLMMSAVQLEHHGRYCS